MPSRIPPLPSSLPPYLGAEEKLAGFGVPADKETTQLALLAGVAVATAQLVSMVNAARVKYDVQWPFM